MRKWRGRGAALLLVLLMLLQTGICGFADEIDYYSIYTSTIASMEPVGGTLSKAFSPGDYLYGLTLTGEQESFALRFALPSSEVGPDITVEAEEGSLGSPAIREELGQRGTTGQIPMEPGEYRKVTVTPTPQENTGGATVKPYTVEVCRTSLLAECRISEIQTGAGGDFLTATIHLEPIDGRPVSMRTFNLALGFDPADVKLASKSTNEASETFSQYAQAMSGLLTSGPLDRKSPLDIDKATANNGTGKLIVHLGPNAKAADPIVTIPAEGLDLLTLYFRVMENEPAFDDETICILREGDSRSENPLHGVAIGIKTENGIPVTAAADEMIRVAGLQKYEVTGLQTAQENGSIVMEPDKALFCEGEPLALKARPNTGYEFVCWEGAVTESAAAGETGAASETGQTGAAGQTSETGAAGSSQRTAETDGNSSTSTGEAGGAAEPDPSLTALEKALSGQNLRRPELTLSVRSDLDLSALRAVFQPSGGELVSGAVIDEDAPYHGQLLLAVNGPESDVYRQTEGTGLLGERDRSLFLNGAEPQVLAYEEDLEEMERDKADSLRKNGGAAVLSGELQSQAEPGEVRRFQTRDLSKPGIHWEPKSFVLIGQTEHVNVWLDQEDTVASRLTEAQRQELSAAFEENWKTITEHYHSLYDSDGNGRLDALLYDIQDKYETTNAYYQGLFSFSELYGRSGGNSGNFIHLDTWPSLGNQTEPDIAPMISTMAHETGHMAFASYFQDRGATITDAELEKAMPTWISEGLSLSIEDELFGARESRISRFSSSESIRNGEVSLTRWQGTVDNYALTYLFFQYLIHQAEACGTEGFTKSLIRSYEGDQAAELMKAIGRIESLRQAGSLDEVIEEFYTAVVLKEASGLYGFGNDPDFDRVNLRPVTTPSPKLAPGAGVVFVMDENGCDPPAGDGLQYRGLTEGDYVLSASGENGTVQIEGGPNGEAGKIRYARGAGEKATVTAIPEKEGWTFLGWKGDASGTENPLTLIMDRSKNLVAVFERHSNTGEIVKPGEGETITYEADGSAVIGVPGGTIRMTLESGEPLTEATIIENGTKIRMKAEAAEETFPFLYWLETRPETGETERQAERGERPAAYETENSAAHKADSSVRNGSEGGETAGERTGAGWSVETVLNSAAMQTAVSGAGGGAGKETGPGLDSGTAGEGEATAERTAQTKYYTNPASFTYAEGAVYTAVFGELEPAPDREASLTDLQVIAPENKILRQRALVSGSYVEELERGAYGETGFSDAVGEYDLYLLSAEAAQQTLSFRFVWKKGQTVEASCGSAKAVYTEGDAAPETESGLLRTAAFSLPLSEVTDGSLARFSVTDPQSGETGTYVIHIHANTAAEDPQMTMKVGTVGAKPDLYRMEIRLKNLWLGAVDGGLRITGSGIRPADVSGLKEKLAAGKQEAVTPEEWEQVTALEWNDAALGQGFVQRTGSRLVFTHQRAETSGTDQILRFGFDPGKTAGASGTVAKAAPVQIQEDTVIAELYFFCEGDPADRIRLLRAEELESGQMEGESGEPAAGAGATANVLADLRYTAYDTLVRLMVEGQAEITGTVRSYDPKKGVAIRLTGQNDAGEPDLSRVYDGSVEAQTEGAGPVTQTFSVRVEPGTYTMTLEKSGHLKVTLRDVTATAGGLDLTAFLREAEDRLDAGAGLAGGRIREGVLGLLPGDVDGDGIIGIRDKALLTNPAWYGTRPEAEAVEQKYDLDGDGIVGIKDWNLMSGPGHYGKRDASLSLAELQTTY
ncbi:InlB B-repeat-containing protein [Bacilliculturomica massiliensis]|uniref:InlB B-repeat-containing protein n=1 Tax=Bacilliculturomica massiliensis TaxID=1917867 RepID=UPI001FE3F09F|nr:hypothetical protein [Bacilliculturomica massiliensis]